MWYISLREMLPTIAVPLRPSHLDVALDLQAALDTVYARARYADEIDYTRPLPPPALDPADATWAASCIATWQQGREPA